MDPQYYDALLRKMIEELWKLYMSLPPEVRQRVHRLIMELMAALQAARLAGASGQAAALRSILEAAKRLMAALLEAGVRNPMLQGWIAWLEGQLAALGAGAGMTAAAVVSVLLALLAWIYSIKEMVEAKGPVAPPVGGTPCGGPMPVASNLTAKSWSFWGEYRAFKNAEEEARSAAQGVACPGTPCTVGTCRGNCAIINVAYSYRFLWTRCTVTYNVYCECY